MSRFRPIHGVLLVGVFMAAILVADYALEGGFQRASYARVAPDSDGFVRVGVTELEVGEVRFFRFLNAGNQEVRFFAGRDQGGKVQVAYDANEACYKAKRGYRHEDDWVVCNKCDKAFRVAEVNAGGGGCKPIPLAFRVDDGHLVLSEGELLKGWRYFR
jgi:uncharacterized membrane protein